MSFIPGRLVQSSAGIAVAVDGGVGPLLLPPGRGGCNAPDGARVFLGIRPEHIGRVNGPLPPVGMARIEAKIELLQPTGSRTFVTFKLGDATAMAELQSDDVKYPGETIELDINLHRVLLFDAATERAL